MAGLACGTPEAADSYQQAKWSAARVVTETKSQVSEKVGDAMEQNFKSASKKLWQTVCGFRRGNQNQVHMGFFNWVYTSVAEGTLRRSHQSYQHTFHRGGRARGLWAELSHHWGRGHQSCQTTPQPQHPGVGRNSSRSPEGSGCCRAVMVDKPLQHCKDIGDHAFGVADGCDGSPL